jgi:hypothetical protein
MCDVEAFAFEVARDDLAHGGVVVDHEDARRGHGADGTAAPGGVASRRREFRDS